MKTLTLITGILIFNVGIAQWKTRSIEDANGTTTVGYCDSQSESIGAKNSRFMLRKAVGGQGFLQMGYAPSINGFWGDDHFQEITSIFVFYGSGDETHQFNTSSGGYHKEGNDKYWLYFNDSKLISYFKKYNKVKVTLDNKSWVFSLSGFTTCYNNIIG